jgi:hypothetical protein
MIWALIAVGILGLTIGIYAGIAGASIAAANRHACECDRLATVARAAAVSRDNWRARALAAERWLPQEVVADILAEEVQAG